MSPFQSIMGRRSEKSPRVAPAERTPNKTRNLGISLLAEFVGTVLFLLFAFIGTHVAYLNSPNVANIRGAPANLDTLMYIALSFGFSLAVTSWIFFRIGGGLFNPAVTLGLMLIRTMPLLRGSLLILVQFIGAIVAAAIASGLVPGSLDARPTLGGGTSHAQGVFIEMFLTILLILTVYFLTSEKLQNPYIAPIGFGLAQFVAMLAGTYFTGGGLNPARAFGPCVAERSFPGHHWIYWVGPGLGSIVSAGLYWIMKMLRSDDQADVSQHGRQIEMEDGRQDHGRYAVNGGHVNSGHVNGNH